MTSEVSPPRTRARWVVVPVVAGFVLLQLAWAFAVPPFAGIDEFDHAYRAAAVARGQWVAQPAAISGGNGAVMHVPRDIVRAAGPECWNLPYTSAGDCAPGRALSNGLVTVGSAAGRYNPVYYDIVGTPALPFSASTALYAMRAASIALCSLFFGLAVWALTRWSRGRVPLIALLVTTTPMLVYSGAVVAPNGLEIVAALALWCSLLGLVVASNGAGLSSRASRPLWLVAGLAGSVLVTLRSMGPLWLALIVVTTVLVAPDRRAFVTGALRSRVGKLSTVVVGGAGVAAVVWTLTMHATALREAPDMPLLSLGARLSKSVLQLPLWLLQSMGAFPLRNEPAPTWLYACVFVLFAFLIWACRSHLRNRVGVGIVVLVVVSCVIPVVLSVATFERYGLAWQGRYELPYTVGFALLLGFAADRARQTRAVSRRWVFIPVALFVVAQTVGTVHVLNMERADSPLAGTAAWWMPSPALLVATTVIGGVLMWLPLLRSSSAEIERPPEEPAAVVPVLTTAPH